MNRYDDSTGDMKLIARQKIWLTIVVVANLALWAIPSDVAEQIARDRHTMLGRYSRTHFAWIIGVAVISIIGLYIDSAVGERYKRRWFQVLATLLFLAPLLAAADFFLRSSERSHYVKDSLAYHRPPRSAFHAEFHDRPEAYRTFPDAPDGFGTVSCSLTTDDRGFRNAGVRDTNDIVVLGDSFAEGSNVSDEHVWPVLLESKTGWSVCNLGMSGYDPLNYRESLREHGLSLQPKVVLCLLYEGNDFRSDRGDTERHAPAWSERFSTYLKQSPIIESIDTLLIRAFGPINANGRVNGIETLDWVPLAVPPGPLAKRYAFAPKQVIDLYKSREEFESERKWSNTRRILDEMREACDRAGCAFVLAYAPTKAHVTIPLVADSLPAERVRAFVTLEKEIDLPDAATFLSELLERVDARESVVRDWCRFAGIPFLSLTIPMRAAAAGGRQVYYTYDQHWSPVGHAVVAEAVAEWLRSMPSVTSRDASVTPERDSG